MSTMKDKKRTSVKICWNKLTEEEKSAFWARVVTLKSERNGE